MNRDDKLLGEAYDQVSEGMFDRLSARRAGNQAVKAAGGKTGISGAIQNAKHGIIKGLGGTLNRKDANQSRKDNIARSRGQVNAITARYMEQIKDIANRYSTDITKLGVDISMIDDDAAREIVRLIMKYNPPQEEQQQ
jgi:hypothetical protein